MTEAVTEHILFAPDQFVIVTHYQPPGDKPPVVHVWGSWPTRAKAITAKSRMRRADVRDHGQELAGEVTYWVRQVLV